MSTSMTESVDLATGQLPLKGVVLCCTSLSQDVRNALAGVAAQMGAAHTLDLTADVTHLIVGNITTPKYRYVARERPDVKVLRPDWLESVRKAWMEGGDVDVEALEQEHRLPTFSGLHICVTGFVDVEQRKYIEDTVARQGAAYHGDLTKSVTHLIAAAPEGEKYIYAKKWGINVVALKWFDDSLERCMALDESLYDPNMPLEEQGKGAYRRYSKTRTSLGKHGRDSLPEDATNGDGGGKKLRRIASMRLEGHSQDILSNMAAHSPDVGAEDVGQWSECQRHRDTDAATHKPKKAHEASDVSTKSKDEPQGLFAGQHILIQSFDPAKTKHLAQVLQNNGASICESASGLEAASRQPFFQQRNLLIPHWFSGEASKLPDVPANTIIVSEWWVERCIHFKTLLDPLENQLCQPIGNIKISGFSDLVISTTGLDGVDLRQVAEAVKLVGAAYQPGITPVSSVVISGSTVLRKEKAFYARKHRIPVVTTDWLWTCLKSRKQVSFGAFTINLPDYDLQDLSGQQSSGSPATASVNSIRKENLQPKRLSSKRKQHATPSLALKASRTKPAPSTTEPLPFIYQDQLDGADDDTLDPADANDLTLSPPASQPLREISPNLSPRKASKGSESDNRKASLPENHDSSDHPESAPIVTSEPVTEAETKSQPVETPKQDLAASLAELLQTRTNPSTHPDPPPARRKNRPLGRAPSGISHRSASFPSDLGHEAPAPDSVAPPPSTQLDYQDPEAEAHRVKMKRMLGLQDVAGGDVGEGMKRVASVGTVRDSGGAGLDGGAGVGGRVKGRKGR